MTMNWIKFPDFSLTHTKFAPAWLMVLDVVEGVNHLRFHAEGEWELPAGLGGTCGPDGLIGSPPTSDSLLLSGCNLGCLIGRFGGSSASSTIPSAPPRGQKEGEPAGNAPVPAVDTVFPIGVDCLFRLPTGIFGPLFLGLNLSEREIVVNQLKVEISGATLD
jgi:hypothetical protein